MAIEAVLFDYSGVLTSGFTFPTEDAPYDPDILFTEMVKALSGEENHPWHDLERGEISLAEYLSFVESVAPGAGALFDVDSPLNVMATLNVLEHRVAVARQMRALGLRVGLVTNNVAEWEPLWRPGLPDDVFETVIDSAAVGLRKPEAGIYLLAMERLGIEDPAACVFIDDFEWNVQGARDVGMVGIHCTQDTDLGAELQALLPGSSG